MLTMGILVLPHFFGPATQDSGKMEALFIYITYKETVLIHTRVQQRTTTALEIQGQIIIPCSSMFFVSVTVKYALIPPAVKWRGVY